MKVDLSSLNEALGDIPDIFICATSFEDRCRSVAERLDAAKVRTAVILENSDFSAFSLKNTAWLESKFGEKAQKVSLRTDDPLFVADSLTNEVLPLLNSSTGLCLIDVTTLTHEQVLILIRMLAISNPAKNIKLVYTGAAEYSVNTEPNEKWLSKGVTDIRAVLGFPGMMLASKKLHLIVLVGFEYERAEKLIERYEPALISLGLGYRDQSVSPEHYKVNAEFHDKVRKFAENLSTSITSVYKFEFSCIDPLNAMADILSEVEKFPDYNVAVCPMNTKPSTIGAALAGLRKEDIQLVYAQPTEYNMSGYSAPGPSCTIFSLTDCLAASAVAF